MEKYNNAGQASDDNMAHAHCMLDTEGYKHIFGMCNTFLLFHYNTGCTHAPQCYIIRTLPVLFKVILYFVKFDAAGS
jgi:hypothetical protein